MVIDSSAFVAIVLKEEGFLTLLRRIADDPPMMSTPSLLEAHMVLSSHLKDETNVTIYRTISDFSIEVVDFTMDHAGIAREAFERFGKGRHRAGLNFGDCMSYALAKYYDVPLLFVGEDFKHTDIKAAI